MGLGKRRFAETLINQTMNKAPSDQLQPALHPRSILRALWKRKVFIVAVTLLGATASIIGVRLLSPVYESEALILVESQKIPENFVAPTVQMPLEARLDSLKRQVLSDERLWNLILEFNLYAEKRAAKTRGELLDMMRKDITISLEKGWSASGPGAFRVAYQAPTAKLATQVTNRIAKFFISENLQEREQEAAVTSAFLESQLEDAKRELQDQEARLRDFKELYNGELPEQENRLLASMAQDKAELLGIQDSLSRVQQNKLILESSLATAEENLNTLQELRQPRVQTSSSPTPVATEPETPTKLEQDRAQLAALRLRYEDKFPDIQRLLLEIAELEKAQKNRPKPATATVSHVANPTPPDSAAGALAGEPRNDAALLAKERVDTVKAQLSVAQHEIATLQQRRDHVLEDVAEIQGHIQRLPIREQQLVSLARDYETRKAEYQALLNKKMAADVAANMEHWQKAERFVMLNEPRSPEKPIKPKRLLLTIAGALLSLITAAGLAFLQGLKRDVFLGEWELPAGTVVVGRVPYFESKGL